MKRLLIINSLLIIFFNLIGQPIVVDWQTELNEYRVIAKKAFEKALDDYEILGNLSDSLIIKEHFSQKDSILYTITYNIDSSSFLNMYLKSSDLINNRTIHLIFNPDNTLYSISHLKNGIEIYSASYDNGRPFQISKNAKIINENRYLLMRYSNKNGRLSSVFSYNNSVSYIKNGLSVFFAFRKSKKVYWLKYYDNNKLLYGLRNYQNGAKMDETVVDSNNLDLHTTYRYNKRHKIITIFYNNFSDNNPSSSYISFKQGRIVEEKITIYIGHDNKKRMEKIIYYDRKHNIKKIDIKN